MAVTRELNSTAAEDKALRRILSQLEAELRDVNASVALKEQLLKDYLTSGFSGIGLRSSFSDRNLEKKKLYMMKKNN